MHDPFHSSCPSLLSSWHVQAEVYSKLPGQLCVGIMGQDNPQIASRAVVTLKYNNLPKYVSAGRCTPKLVVNYVLV